MDLEEEAGKLMDFYPRIYFACHTRHVIDPETNEKLTNNQVSILDHLDGEEPTSLYELATHMGVPPSTMSITINRLEQGGYVVRRKNKIDARKVEILLSEEGIRIRKAKSILDPERVSAMLQRLSEKERQVALDGLGLLAFAAEMEMKSRSLSKSWNTR